MVGGDVRVSARGGKREGVGGVRENMIAGDELPEAAGGVAGCGAEDKLAGEEDVSGGHQRIASGITFGSGNDLVGRAEGTVAEDVPAHEDLRGGAGVRAYLW